MTEQPYDVVAYGFAYFVNEKGMKWWGNDNPNEAEVACKSNDRGFWHHIAVRLRNGQVIRVRPRRSLPATARCE